MSNTQPKRPPLNLGPMGGDPEYVLRRVEALCRTFGALLDADIQLCDDPTGGKTDCYSTIWLPLQDPEAYLVAEHELSHWLFESDPFLAQSFIKQMTSKLLHRAGLKPGTDEAMPYEAHLSRVVHMIANILEDHRCAGLWGTLYPGGEELLRERWKSIMEHEVPDGMAEANLLTFFCKAAHGIDVPGAPQEFQDCKPAFQRALNLVEGVDAAACLGISARFIDEVLDELLANNPPPPPPPPSGGGGGQQQQQQQQQQQGKGKKSPNRHPGKKKKESQEAENKQALKSLLDKVPRKGQFSLRNGPAGQDGMGSESIRVPADPKVQRKMERKASTNNHEIKRIMKADEQGSDESGMTPLQLMMHNGAEAMEDRLEQARQAMCRNQDDSDQATSQVILGWSRVSGIRKVDVTPTNPLPPPTQGGYEAKRALEQFRMKKRRKQAKEGDFHAGHFLNALGAGQLDRDFHVKRVRIPLFELLFLFDFSGSMFMGQALQLVERALADSIFATLAIKSKAHMWGYSDGLYSFTEPGSIFKVPGLISGSTMMVQALDVARLWAKQSPTKRAIIHLTDGWPTSCRAQRSTGNPLTDLRDVLDEIRKEVPITNLTIRHPSQQVDDARKMYDQAFGEGKYAMLSSMDDVPPAIVQAVTILAKSHIEKNARTS